MNPFIMYNKNMASRIIHYAITKELLKYYKVKDKNRFYLGSILPDASISQNRETHFNKYLDNDTKKTHDLTLFRKKYLDKMLIDDLYLGYYLHLLEDIIFRQYMYNKFEFNPYEKGYIKRLHLDYHILNKYYIDKYDLKFEIEIPNDIYNEELLKEYEFDIENFLEEMKKDFEDNEEDEAIFLTKEKADSYIKNVIDICIHEIDAIFINHNYLNEDDYKWIRH